LSHDLRGPFTSIVGFSELLIENIRKNDFEDIENYASVISESSHNAMNLLTNLIEWSRLQTGRIKFNPAVFDINSIISEVIDLLFASAHQKSIIITSDVPSQMNIFGDRFMISTVLRNLISNAIKFSYPKGKISISAMQKGAEVNVKVSDNGIGMNREAIEKLFNFEENFSTPGTQNEMGTGLGMIICKEFMTKHNGKILVESKFGKGTSIILTLPYLHT
jgi:signal transduction histidine kinase